MEKRMSLTLSRSEAFELVAQHLTDMIVGDRHNVLDHVRAGTVGSLTLNLPAMTPKEVAEYIAEVNLAERLGLENGVDAVFVALDDANYDFCLVWERNMKAPEKSTEDSFIFPKSFLFRDAQNTALDVLDLPADYNKRGEKEIDFL